MHIKSLAYFVRYGLLMLCCILCVAFLTACNDLSGTGNAASTATVSPTASTQEATAQPTPPPAPTATATPTVIWPSGREYPSLTYSAKAGGLLLFGGESSQAGSLTDTWLWNGNTWTQQHPTVSPPPVDGEMAFDAATGQTLLFGGNDGTKDLSDTWLWDGTNWVQLHPANSPSPREADSMVYDAATGQVILFGGEDGATPPAGKQVNTLNDTWTWDGTNWSKLTPPTSPPAMGPALPTMPRRKAFFCLVGTTDPGLPPC